MMTGLRNMLHPLLRWYHTVRHLRWQQFWYRAWYPLKRAVYRAGKARPGDIRDASRFPQLKFPVYNWQQGIYDPAEHSFIFLNTRHCFGRHIDWEYASNGLLWTYHLNYFDWLADPALSVADKLDTIHSWIAKEPSNHTGLQSYPSSLRIVNWIRFLSVTGNREELILHSLYRQAHRLVRFPEYHIMGNHLLENGLAYIWISVFFPGMAMKGNLDMVQQQLQEQVLQDGAHFERSIQYHSILLQKIFDLLQAGRQAEIYESGMLYKQLYEKAVLMLSWLKSMHFESGNHPCFGDCTVAGYPSIAESEAVAQDLMITGGQSLLSDSGYRKYSSDGFEMFFNCGKISPGYQPGHAHADLFSFCMEYKGRPCIVDTGISTYDAGARRELERSTAAHNTVSVAGGNSSDVWRSFRVGQRAGPEIEEEHSCGITAVHDGYTAAYGIRHRRSIRIGSNALQITDQLEGRREQPAALYLHFYPGLQPECIAEGVIWLESLELRLSFTGIKISIEAYEYCIGFNVRVPAMRVKGIFETDTAIVMMEPVVCRNLLMS